MARARRAAGDHWDWPADYARYRGISRQAVYKAIAEGRIQLVEGRINRLEADREWADSTAPPVPPSGGGPVQPGTPATYNQVRTLQQFYRAQLAKLDYEERAARLVDAEKVKQAAFEQGRRTKEKILAVPARVAPALAAAKTRAECARIVADELRRVLEELGLTPVARAKAS